MIKIYVNSNGLIVSHSRDCSSPELPGLRSFYCLMDMPLVDEDGAFRSITDLGITEDQFLDYEARAKLAETDHRLARTVEDFVDILSGKGIMSEDDLPDEAKALISSRKAYRQYLK